MSLYQVLSPITKGEIVLAACEVMNRSYDYFTNLDHRENLQSNLQRMNNLLRFRYGEGSSHGHAISSLRPSISKVLAKMEDFFGTPWEREKERLEILSSFWSFRDIAAAQVEAPQYPYSEQIFGQPFLLSEEKLLIVELMSGNIDEETLLSKIISDSYDPQGGFSPDKFEMTIEGACRNFELGIIFANRGNTCEALKQLVRSFLVFLPSRNLWWRNWTANFIFSRDSLVEMVKQQENDFAVKLLLEESNRQGSVAASVDEFNKKTDEVLADFVDFKWLNSPLAETAESRLDFGVVRNHAPWWWHFKKQ